MDINELIFFVIPLQRWKKKAYEQFGCFLWSPDQLRFFLGVLQQSLGSFILRQTRSLAIMNSILEDFSLLQKPVSHLFKTHHNRKAAARILTTAQVKLSPNQKPTKLL